MCGKYRRKSIHNCSSPYASQQWFEKLMSRVSRSLRGPYKRTICKKTRSKEYWEQYNAVRHTNQTQLQCMDGRSLTDIGHMLHKFGWKNLIQICEKYLEQFWWKEFHSFWANATQNEARNIFQKNMWQIFRTVLVGGSWPNSGIFLGYTHLSRYSLPDFGQTPGKRNQGTYFTQICETYLEQFWWK